MHVQHLLYEPRRSGISTSVLSLVRALPEVRHSVLLPAGLDGVAGDLVALGAEVREVALGSKVLPRAAWGELPRAIRAAQADLLHVHALEAGLFGALAGALGRARRLVFTPQTTRIRRRRLLPLLRLLLRAAGSSYTAWVAVSRGQLEELRGLAPAGRVFHVPNAAPPRLQLPLREEARARLGWPEAGRVVACVGRLAAQKDPWTFLRAAAGLPQHLGVLVGEGPLEAELRAFAGGRPHLRLQGPVRPIEDVWAGADLVALPSRWEGLPYALLEAMSHGLPVVASAIEGNTDLVRHEVTGLLVPPGDPRALGAALRRLLEEPALAARLGAAGRALVEAEHSEAELGRRMREVYGHAMA